MDSDAVLTQLRAELRGEPDEGTLARVRSTFESLDNWLTRGGFLPREWVKNRWGG